MVPVEQNQPTTPNNPPPADIPADAVTIDDGAGEIIAPAQATPAAQQDEAPEKIEMRFAPDDRRAAIYASASARRKAETQTFSGDMNDPDLLFGVDADTSTMSPLMREAHDKRMENLRNLAGQPQQQEQPAQQRPAADVRPPLNGMAPERLAEMVPVIVDGREMLVPLSDMIRSHQTQAAADQRLAQAKAILEQARAYQQQPPAQTEIRQEAPSERSNAHTSRQLPENAADLAEKIQMGSPEEVFSALQQLTDSASRRESGLDDTTRVLSVLEDQKAREAVESFAQANPDLVTDQLFQTVTASFIEQEQLRDLHAAGYTVDQVKNALTRPNGLAELHKYARAQRFTGVRSVDKLLTSAHQQAVQWRGGAPAQQQTNRQPGVPVYTSPATREQRKEMLQSQPLARRMSPQAASAQPQPRSQEASRQAGFDQIRAARGLPSQKR